VALPPRAAAGGPGRAGRPALLRHDLHVRILDRAEDPRAGEAVARPDRAGGAAPAGRAAPSGRRPRAARAGGRSARRRAGPGRGGRVMTAPRALVDIMIP